MTTFGFLPKIYFFFTAHIKNLPTPCIFFLNPHTMFLNHMINHTKFHELLLNQNTCILCIKCFSTSSKQFRTALSTTYDRIHLILFKGCDRYIFASLFFKCNGEHSWNKEKCFLFHFIGSFRFRENQILEF